MFLMLDKNKENEGDDDGNDDEELYLETPKQVQDFLSSSSSSSSSSKASFSLKRRRRRRSHAISRVRLSSKLFGPPYMSLPYRQRRELLERIGTLWRQQQEDKKNRQQSTTTKSPPSSLIIEGTIMGQVLPGELVALALQVVEHHDDDDPSATKSSKIPQLSPILFSDYSSSISSRLQILQIHGGLVFDSLSSSVVNLALALSSSPLLKHVTIRNFLNHVRPITNVSLLDPILQAITTTRTRMTTLVSPTTSSSLDSTKSKGLEYLELSCLASFVPWQRPLLSTNILGSFLKSSRHTLHHLELTNLGLEDDHVSVLIDEMKATTKVMTTTTTTNNQHHHGKEEISPSPPSSSSPLREIIWNANENTLRGLVDMIHAIVPGGGSSDSTGTTATTSSSLGVAVFPNLTRLSMANHVKITDKLLDVLIEALQKDHPSHKILNLQYFDCTFSVSQQQKCGYGRRQSLQMYMQLNRLPLAKWFYHPEYATPRAAINHVLSKASAKGASFSLDVLYLLLRERPDLCDVDKNRYVCATNNVVLVTRGYTGQRCWWLWGRRPRWSTATTTTATTVSTTTSSRSRRSCDVYVVVMAVMVAMGVLPLLLFLWWQFSKNSLVADASWLLSTLTAPPKTTFLEL